MLYNQSLAVLLPLPFRRGEGWGEGFLFVVYPAVRCVNKCVVGIRDIRLSPKFLFR